MAEIVITLSDREYAEILKLYNKKSKTLLYLERKVAEGTVLPKDHGRLIDADEFISKEGMWGYIGDMDIDSFQQVTPTIVPAYKEKEIKKESQNRRINSYNQYKTTNDDDDFVPLFCDENIDCCDDL